MEEEVIDRRSQSLAGRDERIREEFQGACGDRPAGCYCRFSAAAAMRTEYRVSTVKKMQNGVPYRITVNRKLFVRFSGSRATV
jgi:hypothetical protein